MRYEDDICIRLMYHIRKEYPQNRWQVFHVANEGKRKPQYRAKLAKLGVLAGVSDYVITKPSGGYPCLFLEIKTSDGRPSNDQLTFLREQRLNGHMGLISYGYEESKYIIDEWFAGRAQRLRWMQECDRKRARNAGWKERAKSAAPEGM